MRPEDDLDRRLAGLARATEPVRARPDFAGRVLAAVAQERKPDFLGEVVRSARRVVWIAAVAAVTAVGWATLTEQSATAAVAVADDTAELDW